MSYILQEIFAFVKLFNKKGVIHGNLHTGNIYIKERKNCSELTIWILEYSNMTTKNNKPNYETNSFLCENEFVKKKYKHVWDLYTLYISIKHEFRNNKLYLYILDSIIDENIDLETRKILGQVYEEQSLQNV